MIHLNQLEFLPIFPYSQLLIWLLPTDHSYFDSVYLKIFTAFSFFGKLKTFVFYQCIVDLRIFYVKKILRSTTHGSTENLFLHGFGRHVFRPRTVPILCIADWEFELWTGSNMGSSDLEFGLETGPVRGLADPELAYYSSLGLDPNWV